MVEAEAATAHDRPLVASVIYNRLRLGMPLQIDATTRYATGNYTQAADRVPAELDLALQHAHPQGPAADADRQSRARRDPGRGPSRADQLPVLRGQAVRQRRAGVHLELQPVPGGRAEVPGGAARTAGSRRALPWRRPWTAVPWFARTRSASSAGRSPTASRRRSRTRRSRPSGSPAGATSGCRSRRSCSTRPCGARRPAGFRGVNVTIPHKQRALALADRSDAARAGDRRRQHADLRGRRRRSRRQHRRARADRGAAVLGRPGGPRWCSAPAAAPAPPSGLCSTPARARFGSGIARPSARERCAPSSARRRCEAPSPPTCWSTAPSVGLDPAQDGFKPLPIDADDLTSYECVVDLVYSGTGTPLVQAARARRARVVAGRELLVRQGALSFEMFTGRPAPIEVMRRAAGAR